MDDNPMDRERCDALDLSGLTPEIIRNWVQLQKVTGNIDNKVRALVALLGAYDEQRALVGWWKERATQVVHCTGDPCICANGIGCVTVPVDQW